MFVLIGYPRERAGEIGQLAADPVQRNHFIVTSAVVHTIFADSPADPGQDCNCLPVVGVDKEMAPPGRQCGKSCINRAKVRPDQYLAVMLA